MAHNAGLSRRVVRVRIPLSPQNAGISASGPGDVPFKHVTRVRIPFPVPVGLSVTCQKLSKLVGRLVVQDA